MKTLTNNHWRPFLYGYEVPDEIKKDYQDSDPDTCFEDGWIKYKQSYLHTSLFMRLTGSNWHGAYTFCNTGAYVIKISNCGEMYQIGMST